MGNQSTFNFLISLAVCAAVVQPSKLPPLPHLNPSNFLPAIRRQVQEAYAAARARPEADEAVGKLGMVLDAYEQYESAAACYQRAGLIKPGSFRWIYYLGVAQLHQGKYEEAASTLREALKLKSDYLPARLSLAEALLNARHWEESGEVYQAIVKEYPDFPMAHYGLGRIQSAQGDLAAATTSYVKACDLFPPYGAAHYALAFAYRKLGEIQKAREQFSLYEANQTTAPPLDDPLLAQVQALNLGPAPFVRRGIALEQAGKIEEAIAEHQKALQIDPSDVQAHINLISLYGRTGQIEKAQEHYLSAIKLNPNMTQAYYDYGVLLFGQGKHQEAEQAFRHALEINPYYAEAHNNLGRLLEMQGHLDEALQEFEEAIADRPNYRLAHFHMGRILVNEGKYEEAIQHFLKTLAPEDETTPGYLYALGAAYARAGDRTSALLYIRKAREKAAARGQTRLLASIDQDLHTLEQGNTGNESH